MSSFSHEWSRGSTGTGCSISYRSDTSRPACTTLTTTSIAPCVTYTYLRDIPFDGVEALTPTPQGDVTLEEIAEHLGDKILLDGVPAVLFMPQYSNEELMETVERVVSLFHPRLVLGISDELPEGTGPQALDRVRRVAEWCRTHPG